MSSGKSPETLKLAKSAAQTGFETVMAVTDCGPYFQVKALDAKGQVIGQSKTVTATR